MLTKIYAVTMQNRGPWKAVMIEKRKQAHPQVDEYRIRYWRFYTLYQRKFQSWSQNPGKTGRLGEILWENDSFCCSVLLSSGANCSQLSSEGMYVCIQVIHFDLAA